MRSILLTAAECEHDSAQFVEHNHLLQALGRRLRETREGAELSVTELARRAAVSRRYVTEAEAGRANVSVIKLAALARAIGVPLRTLCDLPLGEKRLERVAFVGLRGAGKSTIGRRIALELEAPFVELDQRVEQSAGLSLAEIFDLHGEESFHRLESEALERVLAEGERLVLATGGSIVASPRSFERLCDTCTTVWLRATPAEHMQRVIDQGDRRPMRDRPRAIEELAALLDEREALYARSEIQVVTSSKSIEQVVAEVLDSLRVRSVSARALPRGRSAG